MEWFPGRVFAFFRRAAKEGRSRRSEISLVLFPSFVPAAAGNPPGLRVFASRLYGSFPCTVASGGPLSLPPKKEAKETA